MTGRTQFITDSSEIIEGLKEAIDKLHGTIADKRWSVDELKTERQEALSAHVDRLLPNLELSTLEGLRELQGLAIEKMESIFSAAQDVHVTVWSRLKGEAHERRLEAFASEFNLMRIQLTSFIDRDKVNDQFADLRQLSDDISEAKADLADLERKFDALQADLGKAEQVHQSVAESSGKKISPVLLQQVSANAERLRETRRQQAERSATWVDNTSQSDDYTDWLLLWAFDLPTSGRTLMADMIFHDHHVDTSQQATQPEFGGGGGFGGAGASGSWDGNTPADSTPPQGHDSNAVVAAIATDDSLGRYS